MLDILDNAIDAGFIDDDDGNGDDGNVDEEGLFQCKIRIDEDQWGSTNQQVSLRLDSSAAAAPPPPPPEAHMHDLMLAQNSNLYNWSRTIDRNTTTGLIIRNNSHSPIADINDVLTVFKSAKGKASESIGENGVGLKQGCAAVADLSFILIRNEGELSLGIIAKQLQRDDAGPYFPRFKLNNSYLSDANGTSGSERGNENRGNHQNRNGNGHQHPAARQSQSSVKYEDNDETHPQSTSNRDQLQPYTFDHRGVIKGLQKICDENPEVSECIASYGLGSKMSGIMRLVTHFRATFEDEGWKNDRHVFTLIMGQIRHKTKLNLESSSRSTASNDADGERRSMSIVDGIFDELAHELPSTYLHIPDSFDFTLRGEKINFRYWQKRLVELTSSIRTISKTIRLSDSLDVNNPGGKEYKMRILCAFDAVRAHDKNANTSLSMHVYSRKSGRKVVNIKDARTELRLTNSGTDFGQGLTVIVDDYKGDLTLNPRKDGIAFGEESHPTVHKENLYNWIGVVAKAFWRYHVTKFQTDRPKGDLTDYLKDYANNHEAFIEDETELPKLLTGHFSTLLGLYNFKWRSQKFGGIGDGCLQYYRCAAKQIIGKDTLMRITGISHQKAQAIPKTKSKAPAKAKSKQNQKKRKAAMLDTNKAVTSSNDDNNDGEVDVIDLTGDQEKVLKSPISRRIKTEDELAQQRISDASYNRRIKRLTDEKTQISIQLDRAITEKEGIQNRLDEAQDTSNDLKLAMRALELKRDQLKQSASTRVKKLEKSNDALRREKDELKHQLACYQRVKGE